MPPSHEEWPLSQRYGTNGAAAGGNVPHALTRELQDDLGAGARLWHCGVGLLRCADERTALGCDACRQNCRVPGGATPRLLWRLAAGRDRGRGPAHAERLRVHPAPPGLARRLGPDLRLAHHARRGHVYAGGADHLHGLALRGEHRPLREQAAVLDGSILDATNLQDQEVHERLTLLPRKAHRLPRAQRARLALGHLLPVHAEEVAAPVGEDEGATRHHEVQVSSRDTRTHDGV
mmetsp:Transcript_38249/g.118980  ORF Transcript_38249/g.118980 Transcript_38249/m.118980 type:complete len:234 (-) Transcript_38249:55-756(-)